MPRVFIGDVSHLRHYTTSAPVCKEGKVGAGVVNAGPEMNNMKVSYSSYGCEMATRGYGEHDRFILFIYKSCPGVCVDPEAGEVL